MGRTDRRSKASTGLSRGGGKFFFPFEEGNRETLEKLDSLGEKMIIFNWLQEGGNAYARG